MAVGTRIQAIRSELRAYQALEADALREAQRRRELGADLPQMHAAMSELDWLHSKVNELQRRVREEQLH